MKVYRKEVLVLEINQLELDGINRALGYIDPGDSSIVDEMYNKLPVNISDADEE